MPQEAHEPLTPRDGTIRVPGVTLHYRAWEPAKADAGLAPILLLHGLASAARIWDLTAPRLARERRVFALDQRGHGLSDKPDAGYDFPTIVQDDLYAINTLDPGARFVLAGHSWGANVALEFAAAHPERVAALILIDGGFGMLRQRPGATWERISVDLAPPHYEGTPADVFLGWVRGSFPQWRPELDDIMLNIVQLHPDGTVGPRLAREHHMAILRSMWDEDADPLYGAIRAPVLSILAEPPESGGAPDTFLEAKRSGIVQAQRLLTHAPRVEVVWMHNTVHDIPLQRPEELADRIATFLDSL